jgi:enoyl-CoA hydratase/carnithine racemase
MRCRPSVIGTSPTLYDAVMVAHGEPRLRVLLLAAEGPNFCAGGDVKTFASKGAALPDYLREARAAVIERRAPRFGGR